jgi:hypothetical protein
MIGGSLRRARSDEVLGEGLGSDDVTAHPVGEQRPTFATSAQRSSSRCTASRRRAPSSPARAPVAGFTLEDLVDARTLTVEGVSKK